MKRFSLEGRLSAVLAGAVVAAVLIGGLVVRSFGELWLGLLLALLAVLPIAVYALHLMYAPLSRSLQALQDAMHRLRDRDFSASLAPRGDAEMRGVIGAYNDLSAVLRDERQTLYQRELLLDTVIQTTPLALVLTNETGRVLYGNTAARQLFGLGRPLEGHAFSEMLHTSPPALREAVAQGADGLFSVEMDDNAETFHMSVRRFTLNARHHHLYLFKQLTQELNRQEVATWKKVIRVISHELNNSLAPLSSLAHSGRLIADRPQREKLEQIFGTIEERATHLKGFIEGYARFAKLPKPRIEQVSWPAFLEHLRSTLPFSLCSRLPSQPARFDPAQIEQVLINLLKNAHESGSPAEAIEVVVEQRGDGVRIAVRDRGSGMSEQVLGSALLPFYSTKRSGTGLGLPLCREIVEAHGGRLGLSNRADGGLVVTISLPDAASSPRDERRAG